jgi:hypothetical protein
LIFIKFKDDHETIRFIFRLRNRIMDDNKKINYNFSALLNEFSINSLFMTFLIDFFKFIIILRLLVSVFSNRIYRS